MIKLSIRLEERDYQLIAHRARKSNVAISVATRELLQHALLSEVTKNPTAKQVQTACAIETLLLLRKLAELRDRQLVVAANKEAKQMVESLETSRERN